ncbi:excisionase [Klebsiella variicola]
MAKLLTLLQWACAHYETPPSLSTLRRWTREGRIYPALSCTGKSIK